MDKAAKSIDRITPPRAVRIVGWLGLFTLLTVGVIIACRLLDIPLGQSDWLIYRYSQFTLYRLLSALPLILIGAAMTAAIFLLMPGSHPALGRLLFAICMIALCVWTWLAPPQPTEYHLLNLVSPSQDGAFVREAELFPDIGQYLKNFDERLKLTPQEMSGTRVLSNPPGMTIIASAVAHLDHSIAFDRFMLEGMPPENFETFDLRLRVSFVMTALWCASALFAYLLGREFFSQAGAALFCLLVTFNPATVHFSPGKDPLQLLTVNAMLWLWFAGSLREKPLLTFLAGIVLVLGMILGLIHFWIALAAAMAGFYLSIRKKRAVQFALHQILPAAAGAVCAVTFIYVLSGWNVFAMLIAVGKNYSRIESSIPYSRPLWAAIGIPLFLLFLSPIVMTLFALRRPRGIGSAILYSTIVVMLLTFVLGTTVELPRLWVGFVPLLTLGVCADQPFLRATDPRRAKMLLIVLIFAHLAATAVHFSLLDAREAEYRLIDAKLFN
jgi:hypothetical protein